LHTEDLTDKTYHTVRGMHSNNVRMHDSQLSRPLNAPSPLQCHAPVHQPQHRPTHHQAPKHHPLNQLQRAHQLTPLGQMVT
jgi:hypothetical protein